MVTGGKEVSKALREEKTFLFGLTRGLKIPTVIMAPLSSALTVKDFREGFFRRVTSRRIFCRWPSVSIGQSRETETTIYPRLFQG